MPRRGEPSLEQRAMQLLEEVATWIHGLPAADEEQESAQGKKEIIHHIIEQFKAVAFAERERCAQIVEAYIHDGFVMHTIIKEIRGK